MAKTARVLGRSIDPSLPVGDLKVFIAGTSFRPSYGGPALSVAALATALAEDGVTVGLWAPDSSARIARLDGSSGVLPLAGSIHSAVKRFGKIDAIHDNGIWLRHNHEVATLAHRRGIPRVVSTRGMLEPWAIRHKRWKKRIAWWVYQRRDLRIADALHAATIVEAEALAALDLGVPVSVIPNGVEASSPSEHRVRPDGKRVALFLGRIYPVKGLPMLVQAWSKVRPADWILRIAGPDEAGHLRVVQELVGSTGLSDVVEFVGPVLHEDRSELFAGADLFVSPTHSESFGMAIAEALANALPVLTTTAAPWPELETHACGWRVDPSVESLAAGLERATALSSDALRAMGNQGRMLVERNHRWSRVASRMRTLYEGLAR